MRKKLSGIVILGLILALLAGCNSSGGSKNSQKSDAKPEKLTLICTTDDVALFEHVGKQFEETYGIKVELISQAYDNTHQKIATSFSGKADVDLVYVDTPWPAEFASLGITIGLDDYMTEEFKSNIIDVTLEQMVCDGQTQAIPYCNNGKWMFYNKKALEAGGYTQPPKTWDELKAMSNDLMEKGIVKYGIAWAGKQAEGLICDMTTMLYAFGGSWLDDSGKMAFNSDAGAAGLSVMADSIKEGWADPASATYGDRENLDPFMAGDVAFVMNWSFAWGLANDVNASKIAGDVGVCLIPGNGTVESASVTGGGGLGIMSTSKYPDYAWKYIEMVASEETQKFALENNATLPTLKSLYENKELKEKYEFLELMYPQYAYAHFRPQLAGYSEWSNTLQPKISAVLVGEMDAKAALDEAAAATARFEKQ